MKHISISQILTYIQCPEHYLFRYVLGIKIPPRKAITNGKSIHQATAEYYKYKKENNQDLSLMDYKNLYYEKLKQNLEEYKKELEETSWLIDKNYLEKEKEIDDKSLETSGLMGVEVYYKDEAKDRKMKEIEKELRIKTNLGIDLLGYVDFINETDDIYELKTSSRTPNLQELEKDPQLNYYYMLYKNISNKNNVDFEKTFIILTKMPKLVKFRINSSQFVVKEDILLYYISNIIKAINNNIWYCIHKSDDWVCSKDWCGYYKLHQELREKGLDWIKEKYAKNLI